jgi:hypothetical protein
MYRKKRGERKVNKDKEERRRERWQEERRHIEREKKTILWREKRIR